MDQPKTAHYRVTNNSKDGPRGVNLANGQTHYVPMGQTSPPLEIAENEAASMASHAKWFDLAEVGEDDIAATKTAQAGKVPSPSDAGKIINPPADPGAANAAIVARVAEGGGQQDAGQIPPDFEKLSDDELRAYLTDEKVTFHPNTGRPKLILKAQAAHDGKLAEANEVSDEDEVTV